MTQYVCTQFTTINNIYGVKACKNWVELQQTTSLADMLAITPIQAGQIAVAMSTIFIIAWILGELGNLIKSLGRGY